MLPSVATIIYISIVTLASIFVVTVDLVDFMNDKPGRSRKTNPELKKLYIACSMFLCVNLICLLVFGFR